MHWENIVKSLLPPQGQFSLGKLGNGFWLHYHIPELNDGLCNTNNVVKTIMIKWQQQHEVSENTGFADITSTTTRQTRIKKRAKKMKKKKKKWQK